MKRFLKTTLVLAATMVAGEALAQDLSSAYFTQDYKYRHNLNAAFGNDQGYVAIPILGNLGIKMQGNLGLGDILFKDPATGYYNRTFMHPDVSVEEALAGFNKNNKITADLGLTLVSVGFKAFNGYNTLELRERTSMGVALPYELFSFAKNLQNTEYTFDNISASALSFTELAMGHSHQIDDKLRIGGKFKVLLGVGKANLKIEDMTATLVGDKWELSTSYGNAKAEVSMKGIQFKNTTDDVYNSTGQPNVHVDLGETDIDGGGIGGFGLGVDMGAEYEVIDGLKVSAGINDLGFINWSNNWLLKQKKGTFTFDGFHDIQVKDNSGRSFGDQMDEYGDQMSDFINLENRGDQGSTSSTLNATAVLGAEYKLPTYDKLSFGLLGQHHFASDFSWTEGRISANWSPLTWLNGGLSLALNDYCASAGWVLNIHPAGFNFFVGMDHILGKQSKEFIPLSSNAQFTIGMNIAWGGSKKEEKVKVKKERKVVVEEPQDEFDW